MINCHIILFIGNLNADCVLIYTTTINYLTFEHDLIVFNLYVNYFAKRREFENIIFTRVISFLLTKSLQRLDNKMSKLERDYAMKLYFLNKMETLSRTQ